MFQKGIENRILKLWPFYMLHKEQGNQTQILTLRMCMVYTYIPSNIAFSHPYTHIFITVIFWYLPAFLGSKRSTKLILWKVNWSQESLHSFPLRLTIKLGHTLSPAPEAHPHLLQLTLCCSSVDSPWKSRMGLSCLGSYHNVCTILGSFQSNGFANAPACACDEESASC